LRVERTGDREDWRMEELKDYKKEDQDDWRQREVEIARHFHGKE
jgi:hypothetical protein